MHARNYIGYRVSQPRNTQAQGTLFGYYADAPHLVRFGQELFDAAELVKHLDQHQRYSWDSLQHNFLSASQPLAGDDFEHGRRMYVLARDTYLAIHRISRFTNANERMEASSRLTREAYCEAARIPTPALHELPWWRDVSLSQRHALAMAGIDVELLEDGRLALTLPAATFESGSAVLSADTRVHLESISPRLAAQADEGILVEGHTDPMPISERLQATYATNLELGFARAEAVEAVLVTAGFPADRVQVESRAATEPPPGQANPRRVEVVVDACGGSKR